MNEISNVIWISVSGRGTRHEDGAWRMPRRMAASCGFGGVGFTMNIMKHGFPNRPH
jgi:hypothetical protein